MIPLNPSQSPPSNNQLSVLDATPLTATAATVHTLAANAIASPPFISFGSDLLALVQCYEGVTTLADVYNDCMTTAASAEKAKNNFWRENLPAFEQDPGIAEFMENRELLMATEGLFGADWHPLSGYQYLQRLYDAMSAELQKLDPTYDFEPVREYLSLATYRQMSQDIALLRIRDLLTNRLKLPVILNVEGLRTALRESPIIITKLDLWNAGLTQLPNELGLFTNLVEVNLGNNRISQLNEVVFPPNLRVLTLDGNPVQTLAGITWPESLVTLCLNDSLIETLVGVTFPANLASLILHRAPIRSLAGVTLPENLHSLSLLGTPIRSLAGATLPENLHSLCLDDTPIRSLADATLPPNLQYLYLRGAPLQRLSDAARPASCQIVLSALGDLSALTN